MKRQIYLVIGWVTVAIATLGLFLPVLPTTPILLISVWAFGKSSPMLAERIRSHPVVGPPVCAWQDGGVISYRSKLMALGVMGLTVIYLIFYSGLPLWIVLPVVAIMACTGAYVATRPSIKA